MGILQFNSSDPAPQRHLSTRDVAARLSVAASTLNSWLKEDEAREAKRQLFKFHRWIGNRRKWTEEGYRLLENAVHAESENGVLSARPRPQHQQKPDPDAEASLAEVLDAKKTRSF